MSPLDAFTSAIFTDCCRKFCIVNDTKFVPIKNIRAAAKTIRRKSPPSSLLVMGMRPRFCSRYHPPRVIRTCRAVPPTPTFALARQYDVGLVGEPCGVVTRSEPAHLEFVQQRRDGRRLRQSLDKTVEIGQTLPVGAGEETIGVTVQVEEVGEIVFRVSGFLSASIWLSCLASSRRPLSSMTSSIWLR